MSRLSSTVIEAFVRDLRRDPRFAGSNVAVVEQLATAFEAFDAEREDNRDASNCFRAVEFTLSQSLSTDIKLDAIRRLLALGKVENLNVRQFIGAN